MSKIKNLSDLGELYSAIQQTAANVTEVKNSNEQPDILLTDATNYLPKGSTPKVGEGFGKKEEKLAPKTGPEAAEGFDKKLAKEEQEAAEETEKEKKDMEAAEKNEEAPEKEEPKPIVEDLNGMDAEEFIRSLNQQAAVEENPTEVKNKLLERELEAVKATAENLKKKFVSWTEKFKRKN